MHYQEIDKQTYVVRMKRGECVVKTLTKFCREKWIEGGFFYGVGAVDRVELAHYDVEKKKYSSKKFEQPFEVTNTSGSIGIADNDLIIHTHITLADTQMNCIGGHLVEAKVSGTMEIMIIKTPKLEKAYDEETGLKLFCLSSETK